MAALLTPILNQDLRNPNFFNERQPVDGDRSA